jgi:chromosome partitioning protein
MDCAIVNLKGGASKTTTAVHLAALLAERGRTLLVDADPQESLTEWSMLAGDGFPVTVGRATPDIHRRIEAMAEGYEHLIIDTPPERNEITQSAAMAVSARRGRRRRIVLITVAPSPIELNRLRGTLEMLAKTVYPGEEPDVRVLLVRTRARTRSRTNARTLLDRYGIGLLESEVPHRESYIAAFGTTPNGGADNHYRAVLEELDAL